MKGSKLVFRSLNVLFISMVLFAPLSFIFTTSVQAATETCQCVKYVANRFGLTGYPDAMDWNDGFLQKNGFVQVPPLVGSIVVMEASFPGANTSFGHVAVLESYNSSTGKIVIRGANQTEGSTFFKENGCSNVRLTTMGQSINKRSDISFWIKYVNLVRDFNGDRKSDYVVFRPPTGWLMQYNGGSTATQRWGNVGDIPVVGDINGDGKADYIVFTPSTGTWWIKVNGGKTSTVQFGGPGDIPFVGDFTGDKNVDLAVYDPTSGDWMIRASDQASYGLKLGGPGYIPTIGDFDGDKMTDIAVFNPSTGKWSIMYSNTLKTQTIKWGSSGDVPVVGDFNGDGKTDFVLFNASTGTWSVKINGGDSFTQVWQVAHGIPVSGDFNGDGKSDFAVYRVNTGDWWIKLTDVTKGSDIKQQWGQTGDIPVDINASTMKAYGLVNY